MKKYVCVLGIMLVSVTSFSQNALRILVKDSSNSQLLSNVSVEIGNQGRTTSNDGSVLFSLPEGNYSVTVTAIGFVRKNFFINLPDTATHIVLLQRKNVVLEDVTVIATTRGNQQIENSPLKVEVLGKEEMDEENGIRPANIASIIGDISGIQIQQSSATSGNANVRIQGLEGRYTQILRDGMPLFEGFSGNFGVLTIPPLDLKQIELVKGSASTLYGGGAIGGLVNLISKRPTMKGEDILTLNQTTLKESDVNAYLSKRYKHVGYTIFSGYAHQNFSDINKDTLSDVPKLSTFIIHPRLFYDNATIDGDSITVKVNNNTVVTHQLLSARPITTYVTVDLNNVFFEIEMIAENLGSIPPNTALLIVTAGAKKYQLFLTSTKTKSAMIRIVYDKERRSFL